LILPLNASSPNETFCGPGVIEQPEKRSPPPDAILHYYLQYGIEAAPPLSDSLHSPQSKEKNPAIFPKHIQNVHLLDLYIDERCFTINPVWPSALHFPKSEKFREAVQFDL
jgi:hypothetical protein